MTTLNEKKRPVEKSELLTAIPFKMHYFIGLFAMIQRCQNILTFIAILRNGSMKSIKDPFSKEEIYSNFV